MDLTPLESIKGVENPQHEVTETAKTLGFVFRDNAFLVVVNESMGFLHIYCNEYLVYEDAHLPAYFLASCVEREMHNAVEGLRFKQTLMSRLADRLSALEVTEGANYLNWSDDNAANFFLQWRFVDARTSPMVEVSVSDQLIASEEPYHSFSGLRTVKATIDSRFLKGMYFDEMIDALIALASLAARSDSRFSLANPAILY